jgi:hypothetical protein
MGVQHDHSAFTASSGVQYDYSLHTSSEGVQYDHVMFTSGAGVQYDAGLFTSSEGVQHQAQEFSTQAGVQHDEAEFVSTTGVQHESGIGSTGVEVQTEERAVKGVEVATELGDVRSVEVGTEVEVKHIEIGTETLADTETEEAKPELHGRIMCEAKIQTDDIPSPIVVPVASPVPAPGPSELPPPYPQTTRETEFGVLKKWHAGLAERAQASVPGGASPQVREEWAALKRSVGVECGVIDRIVEGKEVLDIVEVEGEDLVDEETEWVRVPVRGRRGLFNVYNTYIVRRRGDGWWTSVLTQAAVGLGFWAVVAGICESCSLLSYLSIPLHETNGKLNNRGTAFRAV